ncbi:MAG: TIGR03619 family F420-dependent LLM class oxidoreductase [Candidatus Hodarchaeales archaeon]
MNFGFTIENFDVNLDPDKIKNTTIMIENSGFESIWTVDHIMQPIGGHNPIYDRISEVLVTLAIIAGFTKKLKLGVSTLVLPLRHPVLVAKQLATLDYLTKGRLVITFGAGWNEEEFSFLGMNFGNRGKRFDEALQVLRTLWNGKKSYSGRYYTFENASFQPIRKELADLPLIIAGRAPHALPRALKHGDGWHPVDLTGTEITKALAPFKIELKDRMFILSVHKFIFKDTDLEKVVQDYRQCGISRIVFDLTRTDIKIEERPKYFEKLCDFVKNY